MNVLFRALVVLLALSPLACSAAEEPAKFKLGEHYLPVRAVQAPANPAKIEVMEVFAYSCPHCFAFEPVLAKWLKKKPADVEFVRMPHTLGRPDGALHNKAYYAADMLGVMDRFHPALFGAIHAQHRPMARVEDLRALLVEHTGVKAEDFDGAISSFAADAGYRRAESTVRALGVTSVPTMVVNGEYFTSGNAAGGLQGVLAVTDFLIEKARRERPKR